jgi:RNA polymerase sigma-32 factor
MYDAGPATATAHRSPDRSSGRSGAAQGGGAGGQRASLEEVLRRHEGLARKLARVHRRGWLDQKDLVAEGMLGLILAWERFDPSLGVPFEHYARWWVRARIVDFVATNGRIGSLRKGRLGRRLGCELPKELRRLDRAGAARPSVEELAGALQVRSERIEEFLRVYHAERIPVHEPVPGTDGRICWEAVVGSPGLDPEQRCARREIIQGVRRVLREHAREACGEREREIIRERLLASEPVSLVALGRRWGVSKQRASQIEQRLLRRLGRKLSRDLRPGIEDVSNPGMGPDEPGRGEVWDARNR